MTKATTSAVDFLAALAGETEIFETSGLAVELRSLTFAEVQQLGTKYKNESTEMAFQALALGLLSPKLDAEQLATLRVGRPGPLMKIAQRVMQLSGMTEDEGGSPLAGTVSSSLDPVTEPPS